MHARETRQAVERRLGPGEVISTMHRQQRIGGEYTLTTISYRTSGLVITYVSSRRHPATAFLISTTSSRYRTADGLGVGSPLAGARRETGVTCSQQPGYVACQGGLGYEKPVTGFTVKDGRVVRVFVAAVAD